MKSRLTRGRFPNERSDLRIAFTNGLALQKTIFLIQQTGAPMGEIHVSLTNITIHNSLLFGTTVATCGAIVVLSGLQNSLVLLQSGLIAVRNLCTTWG